MHHEEHVRETSAEVRAICVVVPGGLGCVHVHALGAVELHHGLAWDVRKAWEREPDCRPGIPSSPRPPTGLESIKSASWRTARECPPLPLSTLTDGKHRLVLTIYTRTVAKVSLLVLFQLRCVKQKGLVGEREEAISPHLTVPPCLPLLTRNPSSVQLGPQTPHATLRSEAARRAQGPFTVCSLQTPLFSRLISLPENNTFNGTSVRIQPSSGLPPLSSATLLARYEPGL